VFAARADLHAAVMGGAARERIPEATKKKWATSRSKKMAKEK